MNTFPITALIVSAVSFLIGASGGYSINERMHKGQVDALKEEVARLTNEARQSDIEVPSDSDASAALASSGRSMRISECSPRKAFPGVTCTGTVTTTRGSFAGATQPGVLSFAKVDGVWVHIQQ